MKLDSKDNFAHEERNMAPGASCCNNLMRATLFVGFRNFNFSLH